MIRPWSIGTLLGESNSRIVFSMRKERVYHSDPDDKTYRRSKTPHERLDAVEEMRQIIYGYDPSTSGLQRLLEVAELPKS